MVEFGRGEGASDGGAEPPPASTSRSASMKHSPWECCRTPRSAWSHESTSVSRPCGPSTLWTDLGRRDRRFATARALASARGPRGSRSALSTSRDRTGASTVARGRRAARSFVRASASTFRSAHPRGYARSSSAWARAFACGAALRRGRRRRGRAPGTRFVQLHRKQRRHGRRLPHRRRRPVRPFGGGGAGALKTGRPRQGRAAS